jgi:two-component system response regulator YesN
MYRALIVDDADINLMELERLDAWGKESNFIIAGKAKNGVEAMARLRKSRYDLVITDIRMPKLDGIDLLKEIRRENLCDCVALFSEFDEFEYVRSGIVFGAFDYLVKPVNKRHVRALLTRARAFLDEKNGAAPHGSAGYTPGETSEAEFFYPKAEEENIIDLIEIGSRDIPQMFLEAAQSVRRLLHDRALLADDMIRKLYGNIVRATYEKYSWLDLYIPPRGLERHLSTGGGRTEDADPSDGAERYFRPLSGLYGLIGRFVFSDAPESIRAICDFILRNPEQSISLQSVADNFNVNNTYLSNLFKQKTGMGFNEYLTTVKIARAKYYLENSEMRIGDISYAIGYADADYFNRLFKKYTGITPTAYRKQAACQGET